MYDGDAASRWCIASWRTFDGPDPNRPSLGRSSAGRVIGGALENSNVDTAEQFVLLIEAQRGYEANAKVITAENELLKTLVQTI